MVKKAAVTLPGLGKSLPVSGVYSKGASDVPEEEEITTPGDMTWVPCTHALTVKDRFGVCEACRGSGRVLMLVSRLPGRYCIVSD